MDPQTLARMRRLRWTGYGLLAAAYLVGYFHRMAPAVLASDLQSAFGATGTSLGLLAAAYFLAYTLLQIPAGVMADAWGARQVVAAGCLLAALGSLGFGLADSLGGAMLGRLLVGVGVSACLIATLKLAAEWFHERQFATVAGLTLCLGNFGALTASTPLSWTVSLTGWRAVFLVLAAVSLLLAVLVLALVRNRPQEAGLPSMRELDGRAPHAPRGAHWRLGLAQVLRNPATWPGVWASACQGGMFFAFAELWAFPFLRDVHGLDAVQAANHIGMMLLGYGLGAVGLGSLSDRLGRRRPVMLAGMLVSLLCWGPLLAGAALSPAASYGLYLLLGLSSPAFTLTLATTKESNPPALSGMATGVVNGGTFLGVMLLQPLVGWVMDLAWDGTLADGVRVYGLDAYRLGLGLLAGAALLALAFGLRVRETYARHPAAEPAAAATAEPL